jgi:glutamate dehydrogenase
MTAETKASSRSETKARRELGARIGQAMQDSLLPGDEPVEAGWVEDAAGFLLDAADLRSAGKPVIELASASDARRYLRIALINDDMPFLVDSVAAAITAMDIAIDRLVHPVIAVRRDEAGNLLAVPQDEDAEARAESMISSRPRGSMPGSGVSCWRRSAPCSTMCAPR